MKKKIYICLFAGLLAFGSQAMASEELFRFELEIDGDSYDFPMTFSDFLSHGWEYDGDTEELFLPNQYSPAEVFQKKDLEVYATVMNLGINTTAVSECSIAGISIDSTQLEKSPDSEVLFPGDVIIGTSTLDDVLNTYGTPNETKEKEDYTSLTYEYDYYQNVVFYFDPETQLLNRADLLNIVPDETAVEEAMADVSDTQTPEAKDYKAPEELGDDLSSFIVEYAGDLYQIPAPVSEFLKNGWTLNTEESDEVIAGMGFGWAYLEKDGKELHATAQNYNENATTIDNCFITYVCGNTDTINLAVTVQKGITLGMTEEELLTALEKEHYELDDSGDTFRYYTIEEDEDSLNYVEIIVEKETSLVTGIEVSNVPESLE